MNPLLFVGKVLTNLPFDENCYNMHSATATIAEETSN